MRLFCHEKKMSVSLLEASGGCEISKSLEPQFFKILGDHLDAIGGFLKFGWRLCVLALWILPIFRFGRTFYHLNLHRRRRCISWLIRKRNPLACAFRRYLETTVLINYYSIPEVASAIGYAPYFEGGRAKVEFPFGSIIDDIADEHECDVCVIGAGAGGSVAAWRLTQKGLKVVLIEEGGFHSNDDFTWDSMTAVRAMYRRAGVTPTYGSPFILVPEGRCVGGTTAINSGTCFRAPDALFRKWEKFYGLSFWTPEKMSPIYEEIEKILQTTIVDEKVQSWSARLFGEGLEKMGYKLHPLMRNAPQCKGSGVCCFGCPSGAKLSADLTFIPAALRSGAKLIVNTKVEKILYDHHRATGVVIRTADEIKKLRCKAVVVSAGALNTPLLLKRSKLPHLSRETGRNLSLHPAAKVTGLFEERVRGWEGVPQGYYTDALMSEGITIEGIFLPPSMVAATLLLSGHEHRKAMEGYAKLSSFGLMVYDEGGGIVFGKNRPIVYYKLGKKDVEKFKCGMLLMVEAYFHAGAKEVFLPLHNMSKLDRERGLEPLRKLALRACDFDLQAFHPMGTCRMGADPKEAVLDHHGRLYGMDNLFVADSSIFPTSLGVNPMLTIMASAYRIADKLAEDLEGI